MQMTRRDQQANQSVNTTSAITRGLAARSSR
jgi:hypothetical protein